VSASSYRKFGLSYLHGILDKENGNVVANNVPVTLFSVELDRETTDIADSVC
jgi:hypothetical protein